MSSWSFNLQDQRGLMSARRSTHHRRPQSGSPAPPPTPTARRSSGTPQPCPNGSDFEVASASARRLILCGRLRPQSYHGQRDGRASRPRRRRHRAGPARPAYTKRCGLKNALEAGHQSSRTAARPTSQRLGLGGKGVAEVCRPYRTRAGATPERPACSSTLWVQVGRLVEFRVVDDWHRIEADLHGDPGQQLVLGGEVALHVRHLV